MTTCEKLSPSYITSSTCLTSNIFRLQTFIEVCARGTRYACFMSADSEAARGHFWDLATV